jgi:hypothetical protein
MKGNNNLYRVCGNNKAGYRISVPSEAKKTAAYSNKYRCRIEPDGTLVYTPVIEGQT